MKRKVIAVCGTWLYEESKVKLLSELTKKAREKGYVVVAMSFTTESLEDNKEVKGELKFVDILNSLDLAGVLIHSESLKNKTLISALKNAVIKRNIPCFSIERNEEGCINVIPDFWDGFERAVRHVVEHHKARDLKMMAGFKGNSFSEERIEIFKEILTEHSLKIDDNSIYYGDFWEIPTMIATERMLIDCGEDNLPDAVICANDAMAITVCNVLFEHGIRVPEDVIVTGFDGIESGEKNIPIITTVAADYETAAEEIVNIIVSDGDKDKGEKGDKSAETKDGKKSGESAGHQDIIIKYGLVPNESCGCKPHSDARVRNNFMNSVRKGEDASWHTYEMNRLLLNMSSEYRVERVIDVLPQVLKLWKHVYMHADISTNMFKEIPEEDKRLTILNTIYGRFEADKSNFFEGEFYPEFERLLEDVSFGFIFIRLLGIKENIYGKLIEAFDSPDVRGLKRADELCMFLSSALNLVVNNYRIRTFETQVKKFEREKKRYSDKDYLTGLYNRMGYLKRLKMLFKAVENEGRDVIVVAADIDNLQWINDNYGYDEGDYVLKAVATAMTYLGLENGVCGRQGGDGYECAIIGESARIKDIKNVENEINQTLLKVNEMANKSYKIHVSAGALKAKITPMSNPEELLNEAKNLMYESKNKIKGRRMHLD
ncbi:MAG: GGDEF domain-containing protein [Lachnospiraceae bacterium]|nr:GGDEF domain-containing protein [Lachnospiraceae bacterium]